MIMETSTTRSPSYQASGCRGSAGPRQTSAAAARGTWEPSGSSIGVARMASTLVNSLFGNTDRRRPSAITKPPGVVWLRRANVSSTRAGEMPSRYIAASSSARVICSSASPSSSIRDTPEMSARFCFRRSATSLSSVTEPEPLTARIMAGISIRRSSSTIWPTSSGKSRRARSMAWRTRSQAESVS